MQRKIMGYIDSFISNSTYNATKNIEISEFCAIPDFSACKAGFSAKSAENFKVCRPKNNGNGSFSETAKVFVAVLLSLLKLIQPSEVTF